MSVRRASYSTYEAARILGVAPMTVRRMVEKGELACHWIGRHRRVHSDSIATYGRQRNMELFWPEAMTGVCFVGFPAERVQGLLPAELEPITCAGLLSAGMQMGRHGARALVLELATVGHAEARRAAAEAKHWQANLRVVGVAAVDDQVGEAWPGFDSVLVQPTPGQLILAVTG